MDALKLLSAKLPHDDEGAKLMRVENIRGLFAP